jgi:protein-tyrosine phosphatase
MTQVLAWRNSSDFPGIVAQALQALAWGELVAFPTETVYGLAASAAHPEAVLRLQKAKGRAESKPLALAVADADMALGWVPRMSPLGRRLARRCWPGAITLVFSDIEGGLVSRLASDVKRSLCSEGTLGLRAPAHGAILQTLHLSAEPLVLTSANRSGALPAVTAGEVVEALGNKIALVIDGGPCRYGKPSTVVRVEGDSWKILREGVLGADEIQQQACTLILFVCTGNTCRSPMAQALCKKLLADRLRCQPAELPARGFLVLSAGLSAMMGAGAAPEAVQAARELGADLQVHSSQRLTARLLDQADHVFVMTRGHLETLMTLFGNMGPEPQLLSPAGEDLADPIGEEQPVYQACAWLIRSYLEARLPELAGS